MTNESILTAVSECAAAKGFNYSEYPEEHRTN